MRQCPPAVITANTHLPVIDVQIYFRSGIKIRWMNVLFGFSRIQIVDAEMQRTYAQRRTAGKFKSVSALTRKCNQAYIGFVAIFLRPAIRYKLFTYLAFV